MTKHFTDENFDQEVLAVSETKPVLVDFFATWCGPCKLQGPIIDDVAEVMGDKAAVGKLDTEEAPKTAEKYGVMSIPTLLIIKDGKVVENFTGMQMKDVLIDALNKYC